MEKAHSLQDPVMVKYFQENLYNVQLVDDIMEWPQDRVEAIIGVLASEREKEIKIEDKQAFHNITNRAVPEVSAGTSHA